MWQSYIAKFAKTYNKLYHFLDFEKPFLKNMIFDLHRPFLALWIHCRISVDGAFKC